MKAHLCIAMIAAAFATEASAKSSVRYTSNAITISPAVIRASAKCEIGKFAVYLKNRVPKGMNTSRVTVKRNHEVTQSSGLTFKLPWFASKADVAGERVQVNGDVATAEYNVRSENFDANCKKYNKFNFGIYDFAVQNVDLFQLGSQGKNSISITSAIKVQSTSSGSLAFKVWVLDVGPSGSVSQKGDYTMTVEIPPGK